MPAFELSPESIDTSGTLIHEDIVIIFVRVVQFPGGLLLRVMVAHYIAVVEEREHVWSVLVCK